MSPLKPKAHAPSASLAALVCLLLLVAAASVAQAHPGIDASVKEANEALRDNPDDLALRLKRSDLKRRGGDFEGALADLDEVARLKPDERRVDLLRGLTYADMGRDKAAEAALDRYLAVGEGAMGAWQARGGIRERSGRLKAALADYEAAIEAGRDVQSYLDRARVQRMLRDRTGEAKGLREGLDATGAVVLREALIEVEIELGHTQAALRLADEVMARVSAKARWRLWRARALEAAGQRQAADAELSAALDEVDKRLERRPNALIWLLRGKILLSMGRPQGAITSLEEAKASAPGHREVQALLKQARGALGRPNKQ